MKFSRNSLLALIALVSTPCALWAGTTKTVNKTAVVTCGDEAITCTATVNAIGDAIEIDISGLDVTDLGTIGKAETKDIVLPSTAGTQTVYKFTPTTGESANELTYIIFDNIEQRIGTRLHGKTLIKIYRRFAYELGDKKAPWIEVGKIEIAIPQLEAADTKVPVNFKPDGTASWVNPITNKPTVFQTGVKELGN